MLKLLKEGYNPFEDNTKFHSEKLKVISQKATILQPKQNMNQTVLNSQQPKFDAVDIYQPNSQPKTVLVEGLKKKTVVDELATAKGHTIDEALDRALLLKTNIVSKTTLNDYRSRINQLKKWLKANNKDIIYCNQISKKMVVEFLNYIQLKTSARNRTNYRTVFSSIFQILEDNEIIEKNFISQIKSIKTQPKRNKTYSIREQEAIFEYLEVNDQLLLLYIKFVSYNLLRPIEVCRLRVRDINLEEKKLQVQAKNKILKTKIIPDKLFKELPDLSKMDGELLLFTPDKLCGHWDTELINRRNYFSNRFKTIVKDHFGYNENYGLYSFRHTFITKLYRGMVKNSSPYNAKSELMEITGHTTMTALEKYLRDIDAQLPEDYSNLL